MIYQLWTIFVLLTLESLRAAPLANEYDILVDRMKSLEERMEREIIALKKTLNKAIGAWTDDKQMTADTMFLATISADSISVSPDEPIVWDSAPVNPGGHFNTVLGMYTAPVHGYYTFSVNKEGNSNHGTFWFLVDEVKFALKETYTGNSNEGPSGSATVSMELTAGQIVRVENAASTVLYGTDVSGAMRSWFTGHLIYAL